MTVESRIKLDERVYVDGKGVKLSMRDLLGRFAEMESMRISDLHLKAGSPPAYRIDGGLEPMDAAPIERAAMDALLASVLDAAQFEELRRDRELDSSFTVGDARFRVNCFYDDEGPAIVFRALPQQVPDVEQVGFPNKSWMDIIEQESGLVLLTGSCGSGKSTTICSLIERIASSRPYRIITLEDPIEYQIKPGRSLVSQRELGRDVIDYGRGLRACLREDPDVIFVGEMRDRESATWTLTAAETGHLVFSTLHTRDVRGTVTRIIDMFPTGQQDEIANQLSLGLSHIISQKLIQRADGKGRVLAMEIMRNNYAVANTIRQLKIEQLYNILQTHRRDNSQERMITMEQSLARLVVTKTITREEAERHANHPEEFKRELLTAQSVDAGAPARRAGDRSE